MEDRVVLRAELAQFIDVDRATIARWEKDGTFPKRIKLGPGRTGKIAWRESDLKRWLAERVQA
jgi:predicted DNA-binding transcriptional regulator AlpA